MLLSPCGQLNMAPSAGEQVLVVPELYGTITDRAEPKKHQAAGWCTTNPTAPARFDRDFLGRKPRTLVRGKPIPFIAGRSPALVGDGCYGVGHN
jgi:hypothetical protein